MSYKDHPSVDSIPLLQVVGRQRSRQLWREMQGAYRGYMKASDALERFVSRPSLSLWNTGSPRAERLIAEQRLSFESYIDARLRFVEFQHDQTSVAAQDWALQKNQAETGNWRSSLERQLLIAANVILLALTVFCSLYVMREQKRIRDHGYVSQEIRATAAVPAPDTTANTAGTREVTRIATEAAGLQKPSGLAEVRTQPDSDPAQKPAARPAHASAKSLGRAYRFRLTPSKQLRQIGSLRISVRSVDPARRNLTISFLSGPAIVQKRIRLNVPVWINPRPGAPPIKLVATRIDTNCVQGYVVEPAPRRVALSSNRPRGGPARTS